MTRVYVKVEGRKLGLDRSVLTGCSGGDVEIAILKSLERSTQRRRLQIVEAGAVGDDGARCMGVISCKGHLLGYIHFTDPTAVKRSDAPVYIWGGDWGRKIRN